jgi:hypothetical protein
MKTYIPYVTGLYKALCRVRAEVELTTYLQITAIKMQRFLNLFIFTDALHVSGGSSAHPQGHITVHTASGIVSQYYCYHGGDGTPWSAIFSTVAAGSSIG